MSKWRPMKTHKGLQPVLLKAGRRVFRARLDWVCGEDGADCLAWHAIDEDEHPPSWTDGVCWYENEDGKRSVRPTAWKPLSATNRHTA